MPAKAGIQEYQMFTKALDPGFRRHDEFTTSSNIPFPDGVFYEVSGLFQV
jgi:hypothetical protein